MRQLNQLLASGLALAAVFAADATILHPYPISALYALPILLAARSATAPAVAAVGAAALCLFGLGAYLQRFAFSTWIVYALALAALAYVAVQLAAQREQTGRRAAEAEAAQRAQLDTAHTLQALIQASPLAIIMSSPEGAVRLWNPAAERIFGWSEAEVLGRFLPTVPEAERDQALANIRRTMQGQSLRGIETVRRRRDGSLVDVALWSAPLRHDTGAPEGAAGIVTLLADITEQVAARRRLEALTAALASQQQWLEAILNLMPTPLLLIEPDTAQVTFANQAADELAGGTFPKGAPAEEYHTVYYCTDRDGNRIPDEQMPGVRAARGETLRDFEMDWHTPAGVRSLLVHSATLPPLHGHPATVVLAFHDITHLKEIEAQLQAAVRARDEFLTVAAHELKTPMTTLRGMAQLALRPLERGGALDPVRVERTLRTVDAQTAKLARLTEQLLDVSRIQAGKLTVERRPADLVPLVRAAAAAAQGRTDRHRIEVRAPAGPVMASVDPLRLEQVLANLLDNAIKYSPDGGDIAVDVAALDAGRVQIAVRDHGLGVPPPDLPHIFDRFYQAHRADHRSGMGLGLYISRQIVEYHGGTIEPELPSDGGTRFVVTLPAAAPHLMPPR